MFVRMETRHVTGLPESWGGLGDTSVLTGTAVYLGMKAAAEVAWGADSLTGKRIMVQGAGKVGFHLMGHLRDEGAQILVSHATEVQFIRSQLPPHSLPPYLLALRTR